MKLLTGCRDLDEAYDSLPIGELIAVIGKSEYRNKFYNKFVDANRDVKITYCKDHIKDHDVVDDIPLYDDILTLRMLVHKAQVSLIVFVNKVSKQPVPIGWSLAWIRPVDHLWHCKEDGINIIKNRNGKRLVRV